MSEAATIESNNHGLSPSEGKRDARLLPKILVVAPSIRIMGGQAVMARQLLDDFEASGFPADFLPINPKPPGFLALAEKVTGLRTLVVSAFYISSLLRRVPQYDIVHIFSASYLSFIITQTPAILISRMFGKKIVLNYHSGECDDHLTKWGKTVYSILGLVDRIVVQSGFLQAVFEKHGFDALPIANVINVDSFPFQERETFRPKILVPRMLDPIYNVGCSIRAFQLVQEQFPDAELTLLGDGPEEASLKDLVTKLQLRGVHFTGRVERDQIAQVYANHDIFLNSSNIDNMPMSILEAFAAGLPVVSTTAGGIPWMIEDRVTGHLAPLDDHQELAQRLVHLLTDQAATRTLVQAACAALAQYTWPAVQDKWFDLYDSLRAAGSKKP